MTIDKQHHSTGHSSSERFRNSKTAKALALTASLAIADGALSGAISNSIAKVMNISAEAANLLPKGAEPFEQDGQTGYIQADGKVVIFEELKDGAKVTSKGLPEPRGTVLASAPSQTVSQNPFSFSANQSGGKVNIGDVKFSVQTSLGATLSAEEQEKMSLYDKMALQQSQSQYGTPVNMSISFTPNGGKEIATSFNYTETPGPQGQKTFGITNGLVTHNGTLGENALGFHLSQTQGHDGFNNITRIGVAHDHTVNPQLIIGSRVAFSQLENIKSSVSNNTAFNQMFGSINSNNLTDGVPYQLTESMPTTIEKMNVTALGGAIKTPLGSMSLTHFQGSVAELDTTQFRHLKSEGGSAIDFRAETNGITTPLGPVVGAMNFLSIPGGHQEGAVKFYTPGNETGVKYVRTQKIKVHEEGRSTVVEKKFKDSATAYSTQEVNPWFSVTPSFTQSDVKGSPIGGRADFIIGDTLIKAGYEDKAAMLGINVANQEDGSSIQFGARVGVEDKGVALQWHIPLWKTPSHGIPQERTLGVGSQAVVYGKAADARKLEVASQQSKLESFLPRLTPEQQAHLQKAIDALKADNLMDAKASFVKLQKALQVQIAQLEAEGAPTQYAQALSNEIAGAAQTATTTTSAVSTSAVSIGAVAGGVAATAAAVGVGIAVANASGGGDKNNSSVPPNSAPTGSNASDTINEYDAGNSVTYTFAQFLTKLSYADAESDAATSVKFETIPANITVTANGVTLNSGNTWNGTGNLVITAVGTEGGTGAKEIKVKINNANGSTSEITHTVNVSNLSLSYTALANQGSVTNGATKYMSATLANLSKEFPDAATALAALSVSKVTDNGKVTLGAVEIVNFALGNIRAPYTGNNVPDGSDQAVFVITTDGETSQSASTNLTKSTF